MACGQAMRGGGDFLVRSGFSARELGLPPAPRPFEAWGTGRGFVGFLHRLDFLRVQGAPALLVVV